MNRLRLLSFNIHGGRSRNGQRDLSRIHDLMERFDIDIGVFQEMETRPSRGGTEQDLESLAGASRPHRVLGANMKEGQGWYGNLIVSRFPILGSAYHPLETAARYEPRGAIDALIETTCGKIRVIGTHLSLAAAQRRVEARRLIALIASVENRKKNPVLLMGDINEWQMPSRLLSFLNKAMRPVRCKPTFPSWLPLLRLDRVWQDAPGFHVTAHRLADKDSSMLSDHLPVLVTLSAM